MVSYVSASEQPMPGDVVLILFVMDNGLVRVLVFCILISETVLILFVMDNGLVLDHIRLY